MVDMASYHGAVSLLVFAGCMILGIEGQGFRFASFYQDNMVLHRAPARPAVWGWHDLASVGQTINVTMDGQSYLTTVKAEHGGARWSVMLDPVSDTRSYTIFASSGLVTINITNVKFGDVWLCSGQSNMAHILGNIDNPDDEIAAVVNYTDVRIFTAQRRFSDRPLYDLEGISLNWAEPTPTNARTFSAVCWMFGKHLYDRLKVPIGLVHSSWGGTRIEAWSSGSSNSQCLPDGVPPAANQNNASALFHAMIHPFLRMSITGAIWYQGEANAGRYTTYPCSQQQMIEYWRNRWNSYTNGSTSADFPFGVVQLAPNRRNGVGLFPELRWAQTYNQGFVPNSDLQNVFMAVAVDLPDFDSPHGSIHPRFKRQVAKRLSFGALQVGYNVSDMGRHQGPFPTNATKTSFTIDVTFDNGNSQLEYRNSVGFEICCSPEPFTFCPGEGTSWNAATIANEGATFVSLDLTGVCIPGQFEVGVRYLWKESPCEEVEMCTIYSRENSLPVPPFVYNGVIQKV